MKTVIFFVLVSILPLVTIAQVDSEETLKQKIEQLEATLKEEKEKNTYLLDALNIRKKGQEVTSNEIAVRVTEVSGVESENAIYVKGLVTYKGTTPRSLQFSTNLLVDPNGLQYTSHVGLLPTTMKTFRVGKAVTDVPYAFVIKFDGIKDKVPVISLLQLSMYETGARKNVFELKGLDISWRDALDK